jgi:hypothetical protein
MSQRPTSHIFIKLEQAMDEVVTELNQDCAEASLAGNYAQLSELLEVAKAIQDIRQQVTALVVKFGPVVQPTVQPPPTIKQPTDGASQQPTNKAPSFQVASMNHEHSSPTRLRITFQGGEVIEGRNAAETFVTALEKIGFERVAQLNKTLSGAPLVSRSEAEFNYQGKTKTGGWYICTHSNTKKKKELIEEIAFRFGVQVGVEIVN